ncbi:MAG: hypothetical protein IPJ41_02815 [Phycisphaerales bacterium]|nr:hypothetical protein [Phycisphaerales bacterium]
MSMGVSRSRHPVVRPQQAAEAIPTLDEIRGLSFGLAVDQPVAQALIIAIQVAMREVFLGGAAEGRSTPHPLSVNAYIHSCAHSAAHTHICAHNA